jgi:hypothetical protein
MGYRKLAELMSSYGCQRGIPLTFPFVSESDWTVELEVVEEGVVVVLLKPGVEVEVEGEEVEVKVEVWELRDEMRNELNDNRNQNHPMEEEEEEEKNEEENEEKNEEKNEEENE